MIRTRPAPLPPPPPAARAPAPDASRGGKTPPALMARVCCPENLRAAWERVCASPGANTPGVDQQRWRDVARRLNPWLLALQRDLERGSYTPRPPRYVDVPKDTPLPDHAGPRRFRRLGILTVRDRVVHVAVKQVLEPLWEPRFHPHSFGFRPGRSITRGLGHAIRLLHGPFGQSLPSTVAVRLDIADCFETIDHESLLHRAGEHTSDEQLLRLLANLLNAGAARGRAGWWRRLLHRERPRGLVQGSALSPLLCNIYLDSLDQHLGEVSRRLQGTAIALRYADDLLILAQGRDQAAAMQAATTGTLRTLRQRLQTRKSLTVPVLEGFPWLGVRVEPRQTQARWTGMVHFGYAVPDPKVKEMLQQIRRAGDAEQRRSPEPDECIRVLNALLAGWHQAYCGADNAAEVFRTLDDLALSVVGQLLPPAARGRCRRSLPRGFWTWQVNATSLHLLSARPPHRPPSLEEDSL
jgi:RNA-directed DNA polymerase